MKDRGNRRGSDSTRAFGLGAVITLAACGETGEPNGAPGVGGRGSGASGAAPTSAAGAGGEASSTAESEARWASVRRAVLDAADTADADLGLSVWDASDVKRFEVSRGDFSADTRVAVASASKFVSGLVLFELIARGQLSLASTTGEVLGWAGANAAISLEHLLSFTSGLPRDAPCTATLVTTLAACVDSIAELEPESPPGSVFDYGSTHLAVAARMAEVASGSSWEELFDEIVRVPLGLPADVAYFTFPRRSLGRTNPLAAGGLRASMNEYAPLLQLALHRGTRGAVSVGRPELFDAQAVEPFDVAVASSPMQSLGLPFRYGLTAWLECAEPRSGCSVVSSPGAFGFTPWLDREAGYVAVLGMEVGPATDDTPSGVVAFAVELQQELEPLIRAALAP